MTRHDCYRGYILVASMVLSESICVYLATIAKTTCIRYFTFHKADHHQRIDSLGSAETLLAP
jgi:hypothetical protein